MASAFQFYLTGIHTGAADAATLTDSTASFVTRRVRVGDIIYNSTDSSRGRIIAVTATTISTTVETGTHNGAGNAVSLTDTTKNFVTEGVLVNDRVRNTTDGSSTRITAITTTTNPNDTLVGVLAGGAENDWDVGDAYVVNTLAWGTDNDWDNPGVGLGDVYRIWVTEPNLIRFTIRDVLGYPMYAEITIANPANPASLVGASYTDYQKVRIVEDLTRRIIFYGKIVRIEPVYDQVYGQVLVLQAQSNMQELAKATLNKNYLNRNAATSDNTRSSLIEDIITDYMSSSIAPAAFSNIGLADTTKFETSDTTEGNGVLDAEYEGKGKTILSVIRDLAQEDKWDNITTGYGFDFWLDNEFRGVDQFPTPDLHYHRRKQADGTDGVPYGAPATYGLIAQYGTPDNLATRTRAMLADYVFPNESGELITRAKIDYVDNTGTIQTMDCISLDVGTVSGAFTAGTIVRGVTSGVRAIAQWPENASMTRLVVSKLLDGTHDGGNGQASLTDSTASFIRDGVVTGMTVYNVTDGSNGIITAVTATNIVATLSGGGLWDDNDVYVIPNAGSFPNFTITEQLQNESFTGAPINTANVTRVLRQTIEQDIEKYIRGYEKTDITTAREKVDQELYHSGNTVERGEFSMFRWPFYRISGTHDGLDNAATLTDTTASFINNGIFNGDIVENTTDGSNGTITGVAATIITGALSGGTENDWDIGDAYRIYVMVRAGHNIRVVNTNVTGLPENMIVTEIIYDEGPGIAFARLKVKKIARGIGAKILPYDKMKEDDEIGLNNQNIRSSSNTTRTELASFGLRQWVNGTLRAFMDSTGIGVRTGAGNTTFFQLIDDAGTYRTVILYNGGDGKFYVTTTGAGTAVGTMSWTVFNTLEMATAAVGGLDTVTISSPTFPAVFAAGGVGDILLGGTLAARRVAKTLAGNDETISVSLGASTSGFVALSDGGAGRTGLRIAAGSISGQILLIAHVGSNDIDFATDATSKVSGAATTPTISPGNGLILVWDATTDRWYPCKNLVV